MRFYPAVICILSMCILAACGEEDPRLTLCKAAVTETVDSAKSISWASILAEEIVDPPSFKREPPADGEAGSEFFIEPKADTYYITVSFAGVDAANEKVRGEATCRFAPDEGHYTKVTSVIIDKTPYDAGELERLTDRYFPVGQWRTCPRYRFWQNLCRA